MDSATNIQKTVKKHQKFGLQVRNGAWSLFSTWSLISTLSPTMLVRFFRLVFGFIWLTWAYPLFIDYQICKLSSSLLMVAFYSLKGARVELHPAGTSSHPYDNGFFVSAGQKTSVGMTMVIWTIQWFTFSFHYLQGRLEELFNVHHLPH